MSRSLNDTLDAFFRAHPNQWIDGKELARIAGGYGWRTRCSDLRKRGMTIENRVRRIVNTQAQATYAVSEYRYVPQETAIAVGHDLNAVQDGRLV